MKKMKNVVHAEGYLYEHELEMKVSGPNSKKPGTEFIRGTIGVATDEELKNIVEFHFTYVTAVTSSGKSNATLSISIPKSICRLLNLKQTDFIVFREENGKIILDKVEE